LSCFDFALIFFSEEGFVTYLLAPFASWTFRNTIMGPFATLKDQLPMHERERFACILIRKPKNGQ